MNILDKLPTQIIVLLLPLLYSAVEKFIINYKFFYSESDLKKIIEDKIKEQRSYLADELKSFIESVTTLPSTTNLTMENNFSIFYDCIANFEEYSLNEICLKNSEISYKRIHNFLMVIMVVYLLLFLCFIIFGNKIILFFVFGILFFQILIFFLLRHFSGKVDEICKHRFFNRNIRGN